MKMQKKHDLLAAILAADKASSLRLQWRTFAADIMAVRFTKTVIDATMYLSPSSFVTFSTSPD